MAEILVNQTDPVIELAIEEGRAFKSRLTIDLGNYIGKTAGRHFMAQDQLRRLVALQYFGKPPEIDLAILTQESADAETRLQMVKSAFVALYS
jgi:hypothetical protein